MKVKGLPSIIVMNIVFTVMFLFYTFFVFKDGSWKCGTAVLSLLDIPMSDVNKLLKDAGIDLLGKSQNGFLR